MIKGSEARDQRWYYGIARLENPYFGIEQMIINMLVAGAPPLGIVA